MVLAEVAERPGVLLVKQIHELAPARIAERLEEQVFHALGAMVVLAARGLYRKRLLLHVKGSRYGKV